MGLFGKKTGSDALLGRWVVDPNDGSTVKAFGDVLFEFNKQGDLRYAIRSESKHEIILMTYKPKGDEIVTDQPSHPNPHTTKFVVSDQSLHLKLTGVPAKFIRG